MSNGNDFGVTAPVDRDTLTAPNSTVVGHMMKQVGLTVCPALFALAFVLPTTANIQLTEPEFSPDQSVMCTSLRTRRREDGLGIEAYSPYYNGMWQELGPLRVPVSRSVVAKIRFSGRLKMLPILGDF